MAFLILVIGDLHIPDRALDIPAKVRAVLPRSRASLTASLYL
jgi:vacuolar protein sorting-associated protein 29